MRTHLLDTNVISEVIRSPHGLTAQRVREVHDDCCTSIIVAAELEFGLWKRPSERRAEEVRLVLSSLPILPWDHPAEQRYGQIRAALERRGTPIGGNDLLIAAQALALDATLVSANEREFRRVPGLKVESWAV